LERKKCSRISPDDVSEEFLSDEEDEISNSGEEKATSSAIVPGVIIPIVKCKYDSDRAKEEQRKNKLKTIRMGLTIAQHDFEIKVDKVASMLNKGYSTRVIVQTNTPAKFDKEVATTLLNAVTESLEGVGKVTVQLNFAKDMRLTNLYVPLKKGKAVKVSKEVIDTVLEDREKEIRGPTGKTFKDLNLSTEEIRIYKSFGKPNTFDEAEYPDDLDERLVDTKEIDIEDQIPNR